MITTKDLREMCQNGVTLDDIRRLYGVNATLEDVEQVLPSRLVGNLGIFPSHEVAAESLCGNQVGNQNVEELIMDVGQDMGNKNQREEEAREEEESSQDKREDKVSPVEMELGKDEEALPLGPSEDQQVTRAVEPEGPSLGDLSLYTKPWDPLLVLYLLSQNSGILDVLTSLEIWSRVTAFPEMSAGE